MQSQVREKYGKEVSSNKHNKQVSAEGNRGEGRDEGKHSL